MAQSNKVACCPLFKRVRMAGWMLLGWGLMTFGGIFLVSHWIPNSIPLPLGQLESVAVDSKGHIFCASTFYSRIQVYSPQGEFLRAWPLRDVRSFGIRVDGNDELEVVVHGETVYRYSIMGRLLETRPPSPSYTPNVQQFPDDHSPECVDAAGQTYSVRLGLIYPHVVRRDVDGAETTVVSPPRLGWFIMGPLPAFLWCLCGALMSCLSRENKGGQATLFK